MENYTEDELIEIYEERAAIREYDGGFSRKEAERLAYFDWRRLVGRSIATPASIREKLASYKLAGRTTHADG